MERVPALRRLILLPSVLFLCAASAAAEPLAVTGTGGAVTAVRLLAREYMKRFPGEQVDMPPGIGTTGGVKAVLAGKLDIGIGGRPLTDAEREAGAVETPIARSPFVFCGHQDVGVAALSLRDVIDIFDGKKASWPDGTPIRLILRPEGETDVDILRGISRELAGAVDRAMRRSGMIFALSDRDAADAIEWIPGAFGVLALGMVAAEKREIKVFSLDGATPSANALAAGDYPFGKRFSLVTVREPSPEVRRFLAFVRSREAASILARKEYIPVR